MPKCSETAPEETVAEVAPVEAAAPVAATCADCANHIGPPEYAGDCVCWQEKFDSSMEAEHWMYCNGSNPEADARDCPRFAQKGGE